MLRLLFIFITLFTFNSSANENIRSLSCELSLPNNKNISLQAQLEDGKAEITYELKNSVDGNLRSYIIESRVWGFKDGHNGRVAGYLSVKQKVELLEYRNYAINHCELSDYKDECSLNITVNLNGVGARAVCKVPHL